jgi:hypothetical protein
MAAVNFVCFFFGTLVGSLITIALTEYKEKPQDTTTHVHTWGKWYSWGLIHQAHKCTECGWEEIINYRPKYF